MEIMKPKFSISMNFFTKKSSSMKSQTLNFSEHINLYNFNNVDTYKQPNLKKFKRKNFAYIQNNHSKL